MGATRTALGGGPADLVRRVVAAVSSSDGAALHRLKLELQGAADRATGSFERGTFESLLDVVDCAREAVDDDRGLAPQSAPVEPGSLAARMLLEIAAGVQGANADLAERLDTDQWQLSRAGRRLRDLGLATRVRTGRLNGWTVTKTGERELSRLRGRPAEVGNGRQACQTGQPPDQLKANGLNQSRG